MIKKSILFAILFITLSGNTGIAQTVHYDLDFNSPTHAAGTQPTLGGAPDKVSSINFGDPNVETTFLDLTDQPLVFNPNEITYEQIGLDLALGYDNYHLSFDMQTESLFGSDYNFKIFLDTFSIQYLQFDGNTGNINLYNTSLTMLPDIDETIGTFGDNILMHIDIDVDLINKTWFIDTGVCPAYTGAFYADNNDIDFVRFSLASPPVGPNVDPTVSVGIDNIMITSVPVPEPTVFWLFTFGSGLFGLKRFSWLRRSNK